MNRRPLGTSYVQALDRLRAAIYTRKMHSDVCPHWDYEETNCRECDEHDDNVKRARRQVKESKP